MRIIFDEWFLPMSFVLGLINIAANLFSFIRAKKMSLTLERSLMFLIYIDPVTAVICSLVFVVTVTLRYFDVSNPEVCDLVYLSLHTPAMIGVTSTAAVAVVRFIVVSRSNPQRVSDTTLLKMNVVFISTIFVAITINAVVHKIMKEPISILSETCLNGDDGREVSWSAIAWTVASLVVFQVISITFDIFILIHISRKALNLPQGTPSLEELTNLQKLQDLLFNTKTSYIAIPSRATLISALMLFPYLILLPIKYHIFSSNVYKISIVETVILQILGAVRFPITLHASFIELTTIKDRSRLQRRLQRQKLEQEEALRSRQERLNLMSDKSETV